MKRDPLEIMREIIELLESERGKAFSLNAIAEKTGIHNVTVKRYVELIEMIKNEPNLEIIKTHRSVIIRIVKSSEKKRV